MSRESLISHYEELLGALKELPVVETPEPEVPEEPEVPVIDAAEVARLQAEVNAARKRLKDTQDAIAKLQAEGKEVAGYLWRNRDTFRAALEAAKAAFVAYAGTNPTGSDPVPPVVTPVEPEPEPLPGIPVANREALDALLAAATGGEVYRLAPGNYGALTLKPNFAPAVKLIGSEGTEFTSINLERWHWQHRGKGLHLEGIKSPWIGSMHVNDVSIVACEANQAKVEFCDGLHVQYNWFHDGHFNLRLRGTKNFKVLNNIMERQREDNMRVSGDSSDGEIRGNVYLDCRAAKSMHGDHLQMFGLPGETAGPKRIIIEQNLMHDNPTNKEVYVLSTGKAGVAAPAQGVFIGDGVGDFNDITVKHNLIRLGMKNAIATKSGPENFLVEENVVVPVKGFNRVCIRFGDHPDQPNWNAKGVKVTKNITSEVSDETGQATIAGDNYSFGSNVNGLFAGVTDEDPNTGQEPEHYRRAAGSSIPAGLLDNWIEGTIAEIRKTYNTVKRTV